MAQGEAPKLDKARHVKYFQRCFKSYLPSAYVAADSTRLTFASFIVSALDLLAVELTAKERAAIRRWVLGLQHPEGGFCGSATHALPGQDARKGAANIAATFFALILLGSAAEGGGNGGGSGDGDGGQGSSGNAALAFQGVDRRRLLRWLRSLQRSDGSFGQNVWEGEPVGGRDMRHSYLAGCIRWMLRGDVDEGDAAWEEDIDVDKMIAHVGQGQTYDGGLAEVSEHEPHAGYAYCGLAALAMLDRTASAAVPGPAVKSGISDHARFVDYLLHRQFAFLGGGHDEVSAEESDDEDGGESVGATKLGNLSLDEGCLEVGFNGRPNKRADSCYTWWVSGTLELLGQSDLVDPSPARRFILERTQHRIGGFSKSPGGPPDLHHSYLGLAALATLGDPDLKPLDVALCCSRDVARRIEAAREGLLESIRGGKYGAGSWQGDGFWA